MDDVFVIVALCALVFALGVAVGRSGSSQITQRLARGRSAHARMLLHPKAGLFPAEGSTDRSARPVGGDSMPLRSGPMGSVCGDEVAHCGLPDSVQEAAAATAATERDKARAALEFAAEMRAGGSDVFGRAAAVVSGGGEVRHG